MIKQFTYYSGETIESCTPGGGPVESGELVKLVLDGTNPSWPAYILATITQVINSTSGPTYLISYDSDDFPGNCPNPCNFIIECATCCDLITATQLVSILQGSQAFCDLVVDCVNSN